MEARKEYNGIKLTFEDGKTERDILSDLTGWTIGINDEKDVTLVDVNVGELIVDDGSQHGGPYKIPLSEIHTIHVY